MTSEKRKNFRRELLELLDNCKESLEVAYIEISKVKAENETLKAKQRNK